MAYVVIARWTAQPGREDLVLGAIRDLIPLSRAEPACRMYEACRSETNPREFVLLEAYDDESGYETHVHSEHFATLGFGLAIPALESRQRSFYVTID